MSTSHVSFPVPWQEGKHNKKRDYELLTYKINEYFIYNIALL